MHHFKKIWYKTLNYCSGIASCIHIVSPHIHSVDNFFLNSFVQIQIYLMSAECFARCSLVVIIGVLRFGFECQSFRCCCCNFYLSSYSPSLCMYFIFSLSFIYIHFTSFICLIRCSFTIFTPLHYANKKNQITSSTQGKQTKT